MRLNSKEIERELSLYAEPEPEPETPYEMAVFWLQRYGIRMLTVHPDDPPGAVLVAEAVNLAAKVVSPSFYDFKAACFDWAAEQRGVISGWGADEAFYLYHPEVGVVCAHDPNEEIETEGYWPHPWHGVERQSYAFEQLTDHELLEYFREATRPVR